MTRWIVAFIATNLIGGIPVCLNAWLYVHHHRLFWSEG